MKKLIVSGSNIATSEELPTKLNAMLVEVQEAIINNTRTFNAQVRIMAGGGVIDGGCIDVYITDELNEEIASYVFCEAKNDEFTSLDYTLDNQDRMFYREVITVIADLLEAWWIDSM